MSMINDIKTPVFAPLAAIAGSVRTLVTRRDPHVGKTDECGPETKDQKLSAWASVSADAMDRMAARHGLRGGNW
ncbi:MAG: hypothetical protein GKR98_12170 [Boseongicola sp.]|nr:MAG: hypothetical protein GKR98_12170 [Boseongicola sp.]